QKSQKRSNFIEFYENAGMKGTLRQGFPLQVWLREITGHDTHSHVSF
ncbi:MAG: hypothetical protein QOJ42_1457, partial [Acidobacteriaceae bacterium]|nr:hypothetical protein [Acidobacteriaceae bacterium]